MLNEPTKTIFEISHGFELLDQVARDLCKPAWHVRPLDEDKLTLDDRDIVSELQPKMLAAESTEFHPNIV